MSEGAHELAAAGYAWEMADAPILHSDLTLVDLAHILELSRLGEVPGEAAQSLLRELLALVGSTSQSVDYDPALGEPYLARENHLVERVGAAGGWLRAGRTRREAVRTAYRMVVRRTLLDLVDAGVATLDALAQQGARHAATLAPDHTYLQVAEPTTFGHYLLSFADALARDLERLQAEFAHVNRSPSGSGSVAGSAVLQDRERLGRLLGFDGPIAQVRDGMWQTDPFVHALASATTLVLGLDGLAEDLEILTSAEFALVRLGDGLVRTSVAMPQKRNPYALTVIRGTAGTLVGRTTGQLALSKSPSARSDPSIYAYGEVPRSLELAARATALVAAVLRTLEVDEDRMALSAATPGMAASAIATLLMRHDGLDYLTAHTVVRRAVTDAGGVIGIDDLRRWTHEVTGATTSLSEQDLEAAADPRQAVESRDVLGGSSWRAVTEHAATVAARSAELRDWATSTRARIEVAERDVVELARGALGEERPADREQGGAG